jgi:hypothetical protein
MSDLNATVRLCHQVLGMPLLGANPAAGESPERHEDWLAANLQRALLG